jgi:HAD superfamily hydrolase (TIGR01549 family)
VKNYKHIIFDLDGVLINSKKNMNVSWQATSLKFNLNVPFKNYFSKIGIPFKKILEALDLDIPKYKIKSVTEYYSKISIKNFWNINLYPDVKKTLNTLRKKNITHSVVTSKDLKRSKLVMKKFGLKFFSIYSASLRKPGKPNPRLILDCIKNSKIEKKKTCYVGDTEIDFTTAKRAKIDFIHASYGYGKIKKKTTNIRYFKDILRYIRHD